MRKCAFLTMDSLDEYEHYDYMLVEPLAELGWEVSEVSWRNTEADWDQFEVVVIRSPWDYQKNPREFIKVLEKIDRSSARLENPLGLVRWNIDKIYLRDLEKQGIAVVPTEWGGVTDQITQNELMDYFDHFETNEIVLKPTISAGAEHTYRLTKQAALDKLNEIKKVFSNRAYMVQPMMNRILDEGEYSLIYFGEEYSHTVLKTPKQDDFRVQEEHGGILELAEPETDLRSITDNIISSVDPTPLYSRVDVVRDGDNFLLMELELIEPSLYFNMDADSPERFTEFFKDWMENKHKIFQK